MYFLHRTKFFAKKHALWLTEQKSNFPTYKRAIVSLFKRAGIKDVKVQITQRLGYGYASCNSVSVLENFPSRVADIAASIDGFFDEAEGVYRSRIVETISPIYWIELILFAPRNLLRYLGMSPDKTIYKLVSVFLTALWWLICSAITLFNDEIKTMIVNCFKIAP